MYKPISFFIGFRYLWNPHLPRFKKVITVLCITSISIPVFSLIIIISIMNGFELNFKKNILSFIPHVIVTNKDQYINKFTFPESLLKHNNIIKISDFINKDVIIKINSNIDIGEIVGVDMMNYENISNYNIKNISCVLKEGKYNAIIGKKLAKKLNINIGDTIELIILLDNKNRFLGKIYNQHYFKITGIFSTGNEVDYYQILINRQDSLNFLNYNKNYVTGWRLWLKNPLSSEINHIKNVEKNLLFLDWRIKKKELFQEIQIEKYVMLFLFSLISLVSGFNIITLISMYVIEKRNAISILQGQGLENWKIILIFIIFSSGISIIGSFLGTILSLLLIIQNNFLSFVIKFFSNIEISIIMIPLEVCYVNIGFLSLSIISIIYPIWNAIKSEPGKIISYE